MLSSSSISIYPHPSTGGIGKENKDTSKSINDIKVSADQDIKSHIELSNLVENEEINININVVDPKYHTVKNPKGDPIKPTHDIPISIILVNYQEEYLAPTVRDLLATPSSNYINEILIIDDMSPTAVTYNMFNPDNRIRVIRAHERLGLIRARYIGGNNAQGPFMILLDAHVKPHDNWLEPIVRMLRENYKRLLNMEVGIMDGPTWKQITPLAVGRKAGFKYDLTHFWDPERSAAEITKLTGESNPDLDVSAITMGMFATTKKWWNTIGGMDSGLEIWGGENIEISFRTWLCGGEIKVARGSCVDHVFRGNHPYSFPGDVYKKNIVRVAEAWLDETTKAKFYHAINTIPGTVSFGNLDEQRALQKKLKCHDFKWYIEKFKNISPVEKSP